FPQGFKYFFYSEATSIYLCPEVKEKKELPAVPQRNLAKVEVTIDDAKACAKPNGVRRRPPKRRLAEGSVSCPSSKCKRLENSPNSGSSVQIIGT
ncbi:hypothetical protein TELCIR_17875, partial [Teladorsagia circumcincta]